MPLIFALAYHVLVGFIDVLVKGQIKKRYGWNWDDVPVFWRSKGGLWEPILFLSTYVISVMIFYLLLHYSLYLLLLYSLELLILGVCGVESIMYWLIGGFTGWERAHWRTVNTWGLYVDGEMELMKWGAATKPDKLHLFELPPVFPWLVKFPMVFWWKLPRIIKVHCRMRGREIHELKWARIEPTRRNVLLCSAAAIVMCLTLEVIVWLH